MNYTNYYDILECHQSATYEELKKSYQKLVKQSHPDKQLNLQNSENSKFLQIDEAWKVIRDEKLRKVYDSSLLQEELKQNSVIYAEIPLKSLNFEDSVAYYSCRCGENIEIDKENFVDSEEVLFECSECSNNILVINKN